MKRKGGLETYSNGGSYPSKKGDSTFLMQKVELRKLKHNSRSVLSTNGYNEKKNCWPSSISSHQLMILGETARGMWSEMFYWWWLARGKRGGCDFCREADSI